MQYRFHPVMGLFPVLSLYAVKPEVRLHTHLIESPVLFHRRRQSLYQLMKAMMVIQYWHW